ncbi:MAG: hypothetical protein JSV04_11730 [Candidatus Heimdallarchaeota archaeon]|nr:MAG: hypothetical protein JSV04_11730 [Candidatus Heimdallarchaeota archaeon]
MTESNDIEQLRADLELITKTSKVLATKLEKVSIKFNQILASLEGKPIPQIPPQETPAPRPTPSPTPTPATPTAPTTPSQPIGAEGTSKTGRLLDDFVSQVQTMKTGKEISKALSGLRDQVMQSAEVGFHPAFHEMGRYANQIKNIREISAVEREQLFEKIHDWKSRLMG